MNEALFFFLLICGPVIIGLFVLGIVWAHRTLAEDPNAAVRFRTLFLTSGAAFGLLLLLSTAGLPVFGLMSGMLYFIAPFLLGVLIRWLIDWAAKH